MKHEDSAGNKGVLKEGWVQWMTAGSGVVHSEMPSDEFLKRGGRSEGFQLWVNLPAKDKMIKPRYQDTDAKKIPVVTSPGIPIHYLLVLLTAIFAPLMGPWSRLIPE